MTPGSRLLTGLMSHDGQASPRITLGSRPDHERDSFSKSLFAVILDLAIAAPDEKQCGDRKRGDAEHDQLHLFTSYRVNAPLVSTGRCLTIALLSEKRKQASKNNCPEWLLEVLATPESWHA